MKKIIKLSLIGFLFLISACSSEKNKLPEQTDFNYEIDMNLEILTDPQYQRIAPSSNGLYYTIGNYIYFLDFKTQKTVFLCNKPECKHILETDQFIGQECNAYLQNGSYGGLLHQTPMIYSNGYLYMVQMTLDFQAGDISGDDIMRIGKDGTNRQVIVHSDNPISKMFVHRNILYYFTNMKLYQLDLEKNNASPEEVMPNQFEGFGLSSFCMDNDLYLSSAIYRESDSGTEHYGILGKLDLTTKEFTIIIEDSAFLDFTMVDDNTFTFIKDYDTYLYFVDTKEERFLCDEAGLVNVSENYIFVNNGPNKVNYVDGENAIAVFNKDYEYLDTLILIEGMKHWTAGVYDDQLFVQYNDPIEYSSTERLYRIYVKDNKLVYDIFAEVHPMEETIGGFFRKASNN